MSEAPTPRVGVVIVAAGTGSRLAAGVPKAFVALSGQTLLERALHAVFGIEQPAQIVVVVPRDKLNEADLLCAGVAAQAASYLTVVQGGDTRQASVAAGLHRLSASVNTILVHDAARALAPASLFDSVIAAVQATGIGAVPGLAVTDTVKRTATDGNILETVDRSQLAAVQTPQGFPREHLVQAYADARVEYTDDAALVTAAGHRVAVLPGDPLAFKITTGWDLRRAADLLAGLDRDQGTVDVRTGIGVDTHAFADGTELWLAGLNWPGERGLAGHSDGDAVAHAISDALLSAAGLGDIGSVFGTADRQFAGAHADVFLDRTRELLWEAGYRVGNVAVQLIGSRPRFAPRRAEAEARLSKLLQAPVTVSATTTDGLGFPGRAEGIAVIANALIRPAK